MAISSALKPKSVSENGVISGSASALGCSNSKLSNENGAGSSAAASLVSPFNSAISSALKPKSVNENGVISGSASALGCSNSKLSNENGAGSSAAGSLVSPLSMAISSALKPKSVSENGVISGSASALGCSNSKLSNENGAGSCAADSLVSPFNIAISSALKPKSVSENGVISGSASALGCSSSKLSNENGAGSSAAVSLVSPLSMAISSALKPKSVSENGVISGSASALGWSKSPAMKFSSGSSVS
ncbi:hypothetical protein Hgul01_04558 [Herpetosiphon gulosus]|uniref:Uncharacterized protein n=1 Tax=Herpetosiphon gulosus TaxID=1973496 RepID=A0ABP9X5R6_9CHLR